MECENTTSAKDKINIHQIRFYGYSVHDTIRAESYAKLAKTEDKDRSLATGRTIDEHHQAEDQIATDDVPIIPAIKTLDAMSLSVSQATGDIM